MPLATAFWFVVTFIMAQALAFDWTSETLESFRNKCVFDTGIAVAMNDPNAPQRSSGPCPVLGCGKSRSPGYLSSFLANVSGHGEVAGFICKGCYLKAWKSERVSHQHVYARF
jgi:hypothetical protein